MIDKELNFGLIFDPSHDELFAALKGNGATLNGLKITPDTSTSIQNGRFSIGYSPRTSVNSVTSVLQALLEAGGIYTCLGSGALGLGYVACGPIHWLRRSPYKFMGLLWCHCNFTRSWSPYIECRSRERLD